MFLIVILSSFCWSHIQYFHLTFVTLTIEAHSNKTHPLWKLFLVEHIVQHAYTALRETNYSISLTEMLLISQSFVHCSQTSIIRSQATVAHKRQTRLLITHTLTSSVDWYIKVMVFLMPHTGLLHIDACGRECLKGRPYRQLICQFATSFLEMVQ